MKKKIKSNKPERGGDLSILSTNIRSIEKNFDELLIILQNRKMFDIIALSETWVSDEKVNLFKIDGYRSHIQTRKDGRRSGGVMIFVREDITIINITQVKMKTGNALKLEILHCDTSISLLIVYRDWSSSKKLFVQELEQILTTNERNVVLMGDINIDILKREESADYLDMLQALGFVADHNEPTRDRSCLDHVMVRSASIKTVTKLESLQITDHAIVTTNIVQRTVTQNNTHQKKKYWVDPNLFVKNLKGQNWEWVNTVENKSTLQNVNESFDKLFSVICDCQQRATKSAAWQKKSKPRQPWATPALIKLITAKTQAYMLYRANRDDRELYMRYKAISTCVKKATRKNKQEYYSELLDESERDPRKYWNLVNKTRGKNESNSITKIKIDGKTLTTSENAAELANIFNRHFNEVPEKLLENLPTIGKQMPFKGTTKTNSGNKEHKLTHIKLSVEDVERAIAKLRYKKSVGYDGISSYIVKGNPKLFTQILTPLLNASLTQGIFPDKLKPSIIVPIFKNGETDCVKNYRPISLLSVFSKIFEHCVKEKFVNYLEQINYLSPTQFGFIKGKSTDTALFAHINDITENVEKNRVTVGVYLDLAKAFDTVSHDRLISKLQEAGVKEPLCAWFSSYLTGRMHKTKIGGVFSDELLVKFGVPQGSVLGPVLFNFYINGLHSLPLKAKVIGYADDTSLLYTAATRAELEQDFSHDCNIILPWFIENQLSLNKDKCECVIYAYKSPAWAEGYNLTTSTGEKIQRKQTVKYLGLRIDEKLTWKENTMTLQAKLRRLNYLFYHMKKFYNKKHLINLYTPLYESVLTYGIMHWGASAHTDPLKILQNKVCRTILNLGWMAPASEIYSKMRVMNLHELYKMRLLMFVFKNKFAFHIQNRAQNEVAYITRAGGGGPVAADPKWNKYHSRIQARYQGYKMFNKLPAILKCENRPSVLKRKLKLHIRGEMEQINK